jgi:Protein of unknown function (DUF938)
MSKFSEAAQRNKATILQVLRRVLPPRGVVLEVASGSGQHVAHFAAALPGLIWQPSDLDVADLIEVRGANILEPLVLDTCKPWPIERADAVLCINMLHASPWEAGQALLAGAGRIGAKLLFLYGPYRRKDRPTSPSNEQFDAWLRTRDPRWGLRSLEAVTQAASSGGFRLEEIVEMPSNNLSLVFRPL